MNLLAVYLCGFFVFNSLLFSEIRHTIQLIHSTLKKIEFIYFLFFVCGKKRLYVIETTRMKNEEIKGAKGYTYETYKWEKKVKRHDFITIFVAVFHYSTHIATVFFSVRQPFT